MGTKPIQNSFNESKFSFAANYEKKISLVTFFPRCCCLSQPRLISFIWTPRSDCCVSLIKLDTFFTWIKNQVEIYVKHTLTSFSSFSGVNPIFCARARENYLQKNILERKTGNWSVEVLLNLGIPVSERRITVRTADRPEYLTTTNSPEHQALQFQLQFRSTFGICPSCLFCFTGPNSKYFSNTQQTSKMCTHTAKSPQKDNPGSREMAQITFLLPTFKSTSSNWKSSFL